MNLKLKFYLSDVVLASPGASEATIKKLTSEIDFKIPNDYLELMKEHNGGEGEMGENRWLRLFPLNELPEENRDYEYLMKNIPDYYLFGKDAADTGFAFHKKNGTFHAFGLMSNFKTDPIEFCGNNFSEFVEYLYNYKVS